MVSNYHPNRVDFDDTAELAAFRARAAAWLSANVAKRVDERALDLFGERDDDASHIADAQEAQARVFEAGFAGLMWPKEYGGRGLTPLHEIVWSQEASRFALPLEVFSVGLGMGGPTVITWGTEEQKARWLPPILRGEEIWCQLFSEPNAGSDVAAVQTRAIRDGEEWIVNGQKVWTSGAHYSKWGMLLARTDPNVPKHQGLSYFIIDMRQPGVEVRPLRQMTGGANFNEVYFTDARVPNDDLIGGEGMGWSVALTTLMNERMSIGALGALSGSGVFDAVVRLLDRIGQRTGRRPQDDPARRDELTELYVRGQVMRYNSQRIISKLARGEIPTAEGSVAKLFMTDLLRRLANFAVEVQGAPGVLDRDDAVDRATWSLAFQGYPGLRIAGGTDEIMKNIIGERVLGLPGEPRTDKGLPFSAK